MEEKINKIKNLFWEESPKKYGAVFAVIVVFALICELFVFNFKWVTSMFDKEITVTDENTISGFAQMSDGGFRINSQTAVIEFKDINQKLKYLRLSPPEDRGVKAHITVSATDEANSNYLSTPERTVMSDIKASQYIRLHFSGEVKDLRITINDMNGQTVDSSFAGLNVSVPLLFSPLRFIFVILAAMVLFVLRPKSSVYKYKTDLTRSWQQAVAALMIIVEAALFLTMIVWNTDAVNWHKNMEHHQQYYRLVESFKEGHFYLNDEVPAKLKAMENPYDTAARDANRVNYKWDHAYHNGKYYCYFGALPAVLLYLPYNLITGKNLPNYTALYIFGVITMIGILVLLWEIIKKWYRDTPFALYLLLSAVFPVIAAISYVVYKPDFYMIPNLSALMFAVWGLSFWLFAEREDKEGSMTLSPKHLAAGSLCIALTAGCRPQFLLTAVLGVMMFWDYAFKKRELFSKNSIRQTVSVCLPFVIVGLLVMWYNFARFGSPFDFGASYNLTTNDMTHRGFVFGRTGLGIFTYFFQPFIMNSVFPFIHDFGSETVYQGLTLTENLMGGVLALYPILLIGIFGVTRKKLFADKRAYRMVWLPIVMAVVIVVMDTQMAGLLTRYYTDFVWLLMLASSVTVFAMYDRYQNGENVIRATLILSAVTLAVAFLTIFAHTENSIETANPMLYYTMQHLIAFWM